MIMDLQATPRDNLEFWVDTLPHFKFADCIYDTMQHGFLVMKGEPLYSGPYDIKDGPESLMKQMEAMTVNDDKMLKQGMSQETAANILSDNDDMSETGNEASEAEGEKPVKGGKEEGEISDEGDGLKEPTDEEQKKRDAENKKKRRKIIQEQKQKLQYDYWEHQKFTATEVTWLDQLVPNSKEFHRLHGYQTYELMKPGDEEYSIAAYLNLALPPIWNTWKFKPCPNYDDAEVTDNQYHAFITCVFFPPIRLTPALDTAKKALLKLIKTPPTMFEGWDL